MQEFYYGGQTDGAAIGAPCVARREKQERRTQALPAAAEQVCGDFRNRRKSSFALPREFFLDQSEIVADKIKNLFDRQQRDGVSPNYSLALRLGAARLAGRVIPKKRRKFSVVAAAISSGVKSLTVASVRATSATYAGSLRLPRYGCGARYGASVSIRIFSSGRTFATSRMFCVFG